MDSKSESATGSLNWWLDVYSETHTHPKNVAIHKICVPVIFLVTVALLDCIPIYTIQGVARVTLLWPVALAAFIFYGQLRKIFAGIFAVVVLTIIWGGRSLFDQFSFMYIWSLIAVFVVAWIGQFVGHKIEGAKPAFFQDLLFLLIGPLWIGLKVFGYSRESSTKTDCLQKT